MDMSSLVKKSGGWNKLKRNAFANAYSDFEVEMMKSIKNCILFINEKSSFSIHEDSIDDFIEAMITALGEICSKQSAPPRCVIDKIMHYAFDFMCSTPYSTWYGIFNNDVLPAIKSAEPDDARALISKIVSNYDGYFTYSSTNEGQEFWSILRPNIQSMPIDSKDRKKLLADFVKANPECKKEINDYCK